MMKKLWWYADGVVRRGPIPQHELEALITDGTLPSETLAWTEGLREWVPLASVPTAFGLMRPPPKPNSPGSELPADARTLSDPQSPSCKRRWWIAGLLNLLGGFGVGYVYVGRPHRALVAMATGAFCLVALWHGLGGWLALPWMFFLVVGTLLLLLIGSVVDAIRLAWNSTSFVPRRYNRWWVYLALVLAWQGFASIWEARTVRTWVIPAGSMQPTLRIGEHLIGDMGAYRDGDPERGDVIIFLLPRDSTTVFIQRVIGLPGDEVQLTAGTLHINGKAVPTEEIGEYIFFDPGSGKRDQNGLLKRELLPEGRAVLIVDAAPNMRFDNTDVFKVPPGSYLVLGDNRDESIDSREQSPRYGVGYVPRANIIGKASWVYWSPDWGRIGTTIK